MCCPISTLNNRFIWQLPKDGMWPTDVPTNWREWCAKWKECPNLLPTMQGFNNQWFHTWWCLFWTQFTREWISWHLNKFQILLLTSISLKNITIHLNIPFTRSLLLSFKACQFFFCLRFRYFFKKWIIKRTITN